MAIVVGLSIVLGALLLSQVAWLRPPRRPRPARVRVARPPRERPRRPRPRITVPRPQRPAFLTAGFAAVAVGVVLRLLWVIWATRTPTEFRDPAEYLRVASGFTHGHMPQFGGVDPSAYWPPGYPALLAPFVWFADQTGWISPAFMAALVNVAAGVVTIVLAGMIARRWFGDRARLVAMWLVALCPALIYWTATAHAETAFTPVLLAVLVLSAIAVDRDDPGPVRWLVVGLLVAFAFLMRSPGAIGFVIPALTIRAATGRWAGAGRATGLVVLASLVLLVPWTIRNGVQIGVWSPASTNNASAACFGHHDDALGLWEPSKLSPRILQDCYGGGSPFDNRHLAPQYEAMGQDPSATAALGDVHEARWYRHALGGAMSWAVRHPVEEVRLSAQKVWETWHHEGRAVDGARNYAEEGWAGRWQTPLGTVANLWLWVVGALALVGLAAVPACRRALPVWAPIALLTLAIVGGIAEPHYRYPAAPLVAVLAAGCLTARARTAAA